MVECTTIYYYSDYHFNSLSVVLGHACIRLFDFLVGHGNLINKFSLMTHSTLPARPRGTDEAEASALESPAAATSEKPAAAPSGRRANVS